MLTPKDDVTTTYACSPTMGMSSVKNVTACTAIMTCSSCTSRSALSAPSLRILEERTSSDVKCPAETATPNAIVALWRRDHALAAVFLAERRRIRTAAAVTLMMMVTPNDASAAYLRKSGSASADALSHRVRTNHALVTRLKRPKTTVNTIKFCASGALRRNTK